LGKQLTIGAPLGKSSFWSKEQSIGTSRPRSATAPAAGSNSTAGGLQDRCGVVHNGVTFDNALAEDCRVVRSGLAAQSGSDPGCHA
jgi:hypothetical protein